jgi:hypothetical protein
VDSYEDRKKCECSCNVYLFALSSRVDADVACDESWIRTNTDVGAVGDAIVFFCLSFVFVFVKMHVKDRGFVRTPM